MASFDFSLGSLVGGGASENKAMERATAALEVSAGAFATAYAQAKMPAYQRLAGIDTSLLGGLVLSAAGLMDRSGGWGQHVSSLGNGALAVYFTKLGATMASDAAGKSVAAALGALPEGAPAFSVDANKVPAAARRY